MSEVMLRDATEADLPELNQVIAHAVMTWDLPERVKRLSLSSYQYNAIDLKHLHCVIAVSNDTILGVAAWEMDAVSVQGKQGLLLHGLYVEPSAHGKGIGTRLLEAARNAAATTGYDGVLVKAQADAIGFFQSRGMQALDVDDHSRDYEHRYWLPVMAQ